MESVVLKTAALILKPLILLFSVFLFMRGHNAPGGGFVGGLVAAAGFSLDAFAYGVDAARRSLGNHPRRLIAIGLLIAAASGVPALLKQGPYMEGIWWELPLPYAEQVKVGTPLMFDAGVYLTVLGFTLLFLFTLMGGRR